MSCQPEVVDGVLRGDRLEGGDLLVDLVKEVRMVLDLPLACGDGCGHGRERPGDVAPDADGLAEASLPQPVVPHVSERVLHAVLDGLRVARRAEQAVPDVQHAPPP
jgi:hypothetical protein